MNLRLFDNGDIRVNIYLKKVKWKTISDNALPAEEYSKGKETRNKVYNMATARKRALDAMLQTLPT